MRQIRKRAPWRTRKAAAEPAWGHALMAKKMFKWMKPRINGAKDLIINRSCRIIENHHGV